MRPRRRPALGPGRPRPRGRDRRRPAGRAAGIGSPWIRPTATPPSPRPSSRNWRAAACAGRRSRRARARRRRLWRSGASPISMSPSMSTSAAAGFFGPREPRRQMRTPVAVLWNTSGSAAANLHPAVVEADESAVPLIVLTADRPPELRGIGAGQTIDQLKLYGSAVRWFCEVGTHEADDDGLLHHRSVARRGLRIGGGGWPPGARAPEPGLARAAGAYRRARRGHGEIAAGFERPQPAPLTAVSAPSPAPLPRRARALRRRAPPGRARPDRLRAPARPGPADADLRARRGDRLPGARRADVAGAARTPRPLGRCLGLRPSIASRALPTDSCRMW